MQDRILRMPDVLEIVNVSRTTIWRQVKAGTFPAPVKLSPRAVGWRKSEVDAWMNRADAVGVA